MPMAWAWCWVLSVSKICHMVILPLRTACEGTPGHPLHMVLSACFNLCMSLQLQLKLLSQSYMVPAASSTQSTSFNKLQLNLRDVSYRQFDRAAPVDL